MLYNVTEAAFVRAFNPIWFVFYIIALDYPRARFGAAEPALGETPSGERRDGILRPPETEL